MARGSMLVGLIVVTACGGNADGGERGPVTSNESDQAAGAGSTLPESVFWSAFSAGPATDESETYASVDAMASAADLVAVGHFTTFGVSRELPSQDGPETAITYAAADLEFDEVLRGTFVGDGVPVEFLLPARPSEVAGVADVLEAALPPDEMVVFLRNKGGDEEGFYRPVSSMGLWIGRNGSFTPTLRFVGEIVAPLAIDSGAGIATALGEGTTLEGLAALVRQ